MQFDYIIIGSGSAGSTLAYRLGENKKYSILVLEYGGSDAGPLIQMPAALSYPIFGARAVTSIKELSNKYLILFLSALIPLTQ